MYELTFGQVFAMFDAMAQYIILTTPHADADDQSTQNRRAGHQADLPDVDSTSRGEPEVLAMRRNPAFDAHVKVVNLHDLPADTREMIKEMEARDGERS